MSEFEKWWEEMCGIDKDAAKDAWRAALEWVKERSEYSKELYMIWADDIDEELK